MKVLRHRRPIADDWDSIDLGLRIEVILNPLLAIMGNNRPFGDNWLQESRRIPACGPSGRETEATGEHRVGYRSGISLWGRFGLFGEVPAQIGVVGSGMGCD